MTKWQTDTNIGSYRAMGGYDGTEFQVLKVNSTGTLPVVAESLTATTDLSRATLNISTATTTAVVGAVSGQTTRVHRIVMNIAAAQTIHIKDGSTTLTGNAMTFAAAQTVIMDFSSRPWFTTSANSAFNFVTTTTGAVTGFVEYVTSA
jgi:hypothetical protein